MAWTSVGFDGTINEAQWSQMAGLLGNDYVAAGNGDCVVTAVGGARSVSVAAGSLYGDGVVSTNSGAETVAMTTPVNGQWYVIALRRTWATNTAALVAIAGATTSTTTPTAPPTSFPTLNTNKGVLTDQPIAWAWCNSANTTVVVYDIRLKAVKSLPPVVANANERDAKFMTPTQGLQVWRDDLGVVETYFGLYNASTNPGGAPSAGWTANTRQVGLRPIQPTSAVIATGSGTANYIGLISFTGATSVSLNGIFSNEFKNYRITYTLSVGASANGELRGRYRSAGSDYVANQYYAAGNIVSINGATNTFCGNALTYFAFSDTATTSLGNDYYNGSGEIRSPFATSYTTIQAQSFAFRPGTGESMYNTTNQLANNTSYDGLTIYLTTGTMTGTVQVFGYND